MLDGSSSSSLVWTGNLELLSFDSVPKVLLCSCVDAEEEGLLSIFSQQLAPWSRCGFLRQLRHLLHSEFTLQMRKSRLSVVGEPKMCRQFKALWCDSLCRLAVMFGQ